MTPISISLGVIFTLIIFKVRVVALTEALVRAWQVQSKKISEGFYAASPGTLVLGILAIAHLVSLLISYLAGFALKLNSFSWFAINDKLLWIITGSLLLLGLRRPWTKITVVSASLTLIVNNYLLTPLIDGIVFTWTREYLPWNVLAKVNVAYDLESKDWETLAPYQGLSTTLSVAQDLTILAMVITLVGMVVLGAILRYRRAVMSWSDKRSDEVFGSAVERETEAPRGISILAAMSLIFAFLFPLVGLILAYAARNEIVHSRGNKHGMELTVDAAIISWLGIGLYALLIGMFAILPFLGLSNPLDSISNF